jgi:hypothetical protein
VVGLLLAGRPVGVGAADVSSAAGRGRAYAFACRAQVEERMLLVNWHKFVVSVLHSKDEVLVSGINKQTGAPGCCASLGWLLQGSWQQAAESSPMAVQQCGTSAAMGFLGYGMLTATLEPIAAPVPHWCRASGFTGRPGHATRTPSSCVDRPLWLVVGVDAVVGTAVPHPPPPPPASPCPCATSTLHCADDCPYPAPLHTPPPPPHTHTQGPPPPPAPPRRATSCRARP